MRERVRVGTVGAGSLGFHHRRILREMPGVEYVGFYERNPQRAAHVMSLIQQMRGGRDYDSTFGSRMRGEGEFAALFEKRFDIE